MKTYNVVVSMADGEKFTLVGVTGFKSSTDSETFTVDFDTGYKAIFNKQHVKYIIREFDLNRKDNEE